MRGAVAEWPAQLPLAATSEGRGWDPCSRGKGWGNRGRRDEDAEREGAATAGARLACDNEQHLLPCSEQEGRGLEE